MVSPSNAIALTVAAILHIAAGATLDPPTDPIPAEWRNVLDMTWDNTQAFFKLFFPNGEENLVQYKNWMLDQIVDGQGTVNLCMRWDSDKILDEDTRNGIVFQHNQQYQQWLEWLPGWDNFPYKEVNFKVIGWAVRNDSQLVGSRDGFHVYTEYNDDDGRPTCDPGCSRHLHQDGDFSGCGIGPDGRFHHFFMVSKHWQNYYMGSASGVGIDYSEYGWETVGKKLGDDPILIHEFGHTFGFRDYVNDLTYPESPCEVTWMPPNVTDHMVMEPTDQGAHVPKITRFEGWFIRYLWSRVSRTRGWQKPDGMTFPAETVCPSTVL